MKKVWFFLVLVLVLVLPNHSFAASGGSIGKIKTVLWYEGHSGVLITQEGMSDLGGCGRADYYILDDKHPYFKEIYAQILAAHLASLPMWIHLEGCVQGISRIKHVSTHK